LKVSEALVGDLIEEYRHHRSPRWYWRQVVIAIVLHAARDVQLHKLRVIRLVVVGWAVLLALFTLFGDRAADGLANLAFGWTRPNGYGSHVWWPFQLAAVFVSYAGFGVSAWVVARQDRAHILI
jgi:hypothetical protein